MLRNNSQHFIRFLAVSAVSLCLPLQALATQFKLPESGNSMIGSVSYTSASGGENIVRIAQRNNLGVNAVLNANPGLTATGRLSSIPVKVPGQFILPPLPHKGIIVNLAEMRMYYYLDNGTVLTYPIGIGKVGKTVPTGDTAITHKVVNPKWTPPEDIREFNREQGIELPTVMGPGPDNPLGPYAIYLRVPTYLIHSTIFPESIGRRASFGCIRMHETDIKQFFPIVEPKTPVAIIDMPSIAGWNGNKLYLESHPPLEEHQDSGTPSLVNAIERVTPDESATLINWQLVSYLADVRDGVPHEVGFRVR